MVSRWDGGREDLMRGVRESLDSDRLGMLGGRLDVQGSKGQVI